MTSYISPHVNQSDVHQGSRTKLEQAIQRYEDNMVKTGSKFTPAQKRHLERERMYVKNFAQITQRLEDYYGVLDNSDYDLFESDRHKSKRLGENMRAVGRPKPTDRHDAHAVVSGKHAKAALSRIVLATYRVGLDHPNNGAWLPRYKADAYASKNWATPGAVPHLPTHRTTYYEWIELELGSLISQEVILNKLRDIGISLESGEEVPNQLLAEMEYEDLQNK
ncbi:MAG: AHH domain-containing protein [Endozoicomonas sp.]